MIGWRNGFLFGSCGRPSDFCRFGLARRIVFVDPPAVMASALVILACLFFLRPYVMAHLPDGLGATDLIVPRLRGGLFVRLEGHIMFPRRHT